MLLGTVFFEKHIPAILSGKKKVTFRMLTTVVIIKQRDVSARSVFTKRNRRNTDRKTRLQLKDDQGSTIEQSMNTIIRAIGNDDISTRNVFHICDEKSRINER